MPPELSHRLRRRLVEGFRRDFDGVPDAASIDERDHAGFGIPHALHLAKKSEHAPTGPFARFRELVGIQHAGT